MEQLNRKTKRRVMIGSPCMYGEVNVWYANSLANTIKMSYDCDVEIIPMWLSFDALIQRVRNDTLHLAVKSGVDDLFWIDCDIEWNPEDFYKLLNHPVDIVGGTYRKKADIEEYVWRPAPGQIIDTSKNLIDVLGLGTGFARMSRKAFTYLYDVSPKYIDPKDNEEKSMAFNFVIEKIRDPETDKMISRTVSEDLHAFDILRKGGFDIWLDKHVTCNHIGPYKFMGDFNAWLKSGAKEPVAPGLPAITRSTVPEVKPQIPPRQLPKINKQL